MSLKEVLFYRLPQQFQYKILGHFHKKKVFKGSNISINTDFKKTDYSKEVLKARITDNQNFFKFHFFDTQLDLSISINWLKDYKNNIVSPVCYYGNINRQDFNKFGDVKYTSEPSRFYFLPFLALKAASSNNTNYVDAILNHLKDWNSQNPYLNTIHWTNGIEVGIRSVNLIYTHIVLDSSNLLNKELDGLIKEMIQYNYHFLKRHLSLYSSANNHLVAELAGLIAISTYFKNNEIRKDSRKWRNMLFTQVKKQVNYDGVNMELSTHYHAEVTDHFFNALLYLKKGGKSIPSEIENHFLRMFDFIDHIDYNNVKTIYGDNDEGFLIYPYFDTSFCIYKSLLKSAQHEYNRACIKNNNFDFRNYLIFGETYLNKNSKFQEKELDDTIFENSGYAFLYDHKHQTKVSFDFGKIGDDISAAHGHSDIFHFTLDVDGEPILVDSGTYQYHVKYSKWRNYFRGITAHNTVSINDKDHAIKATRMSWFNKPETKLINYNLSNTQSFLEAGTNAFKKENIYHQRKLVFNKEKRKVFITDSLNKIHKDDILYEFKIFFNFGDNVTLKKEENILFVKGNNKIVTFKFSDLVIVNINKANNKSEIGWRSNKYNNLTAGQTVELYGKALKDITIITEIDY